jgi:hypothetical protein
VIARRTRNWPARLTAGPALLVALVGLALTAAILFGPLDGYRPVWFGPLLISALAYLALVLTPAPRRTSGSPSVQQARAIRDRIATYRPRAEELGATRLIDRFLTTVDTVTLPELDRLALSNRLVQERLKGYEKATVKPDAATLDRLRSLSRRQQAAIADVLQKLANSDAAIVGALESGDTSRLTDEINLAADELQRHWEASRELAEGGV